MKLTAVAILDEKHNHDIITYLKDIMPYYSHIKRKTYYIVRSGDYKVSKLNTALQHQYQITKRTANSIIKDVQGTFRSLRALKDLEREQKLQRIDTLKTQIIRLSAKRTRYANMLSGQKHPAKWLRDKQKGLRRKVVAKKAKLNHIRQTLQVLDQSIMKKAFKVCFGTKTLLQQDISAFRSHRDSEMTYVGSKDETACNQMLQLTYDKRTNQFAIKLRKDGPKYKNSPDKYLFGQIHFDYAWAKRQIVQALKTHHSPLTYRIVYQRGRYELHCSFELPEKEVLTRSKQGVIGIDFNKGFVAVSETNQYGDLVRIDRIDYPFGKGHVTDNAINHLAKTLTNQALTTGKDLVIENLDFKQKKHKSHHGESKRGRKYNNMLHTLPYRRFSEALTTKAVKKQVGLTKVNPAWTSYIAKIKYCPVMKLNIHTGAAYVIARRGQGYKDQIVS